MLWKGRSEDERKRGKILEISRSSALRRYIRGLGSGRERVEEKEVHRNLQQPARGNEVSRPSRCRQRLSKLDSLFDSCSSELVDDV